MPTIEQIRAARALLGWNQHDLADKAGLSQTGIARIENGTNQPNSKTLEKIGKAFDDADVEFLDTSGVRKRTGQIKVLRNQDGMRQFFNELYEYARDIGGDIYLMNGVPARLSEWLGETWYKMHNDRMLKIKDNFHYKIIVESGEKSLPARDYATYRYFPADKFNEKTIYIFGNVVYFRDHDEKEIRIIRIEQSDIAHSMKVLFDIAWENVAKDI